MSEHEASDPITDEARDFRQYVESTEAIETEVGKLFEATVADLESRNARLLAETLRLREEVERLTKALTPSAETQWDYSGEFAWEEEVLDEDDQSTAVVRTVPWTVIKRIMARIRERAALGQEVEA